MLASIMGTEVAVTQTNYSVMETEQSCQREKVHSVKVLQCRKPSRSVGLTKGFCTENNHVNMREY